MSLPMPRPLCKDVSKKGLIKTIKAVSILLQKESNTNKQVLHNGRLFNRDNSLVPLLPTGSGVCYTRGG